MIKKTRTKELLKRLEALQTVANKKNASVVLIDLEEYMSSSFNNFEDFIKDKTKKTSDDAVVIIDDMVLQVDVYLDMDLILSSSKDVIAEFIQASEHNDEIEYMKLYIQLFEESFDLKNIPSKEHFMTDPSFNFLKNSHSCNGKMMSEAECREKFWEMEVRENAAKFDVYAQVFADMSPFYKDFLKHYRILSVGELVERYKDQRFFKTVCKNGCNT